MMRRQKAAAAVAALTAALALAPDRAAAQCPSWDDMLADGSLVQIEAILRDEIDLTLSILYLNPPRLGACALGEVLFEGLESNLLSAGPPVQAFWIGVSGRSAEEFAPEQMWLIQGENELGLSLKAAFDAETRIGKMHDLDAQHLVFYEHEIEPAQPMRLIYISSIGPVSESYQVAPAYRQ
jgi:hypothetical protein